jgi:MFS transporter, MHS family, proline/betaine transporter
MRRVLISGMIGNGLEWYDFAIYGYFATILSKLFFPSADPLVSLIASYGAFAAGFAMRPLGAVLFGYLGDKYGRKVALTFSILMMAIPTAAIGLLPTYQQIGVLAPILLTFIRLLQGLSLGGEFCGAMTFVVEHSGEKNRGLIGSTTIVSLVIGMLAGSLIAATMANLLSKEALETWGWRIPFILGFAIGLVGFYIRNHTKESPEYESAKRNGTLCNRPIKEAFTKHLKPMIISIGIYITVTVPFYILTIFMITYLSKILNYSLADTLLINSISMIVLLVTTLLGGWLSDKYGRKPILVASAFAFLILSYPLFLMIGYNIFTAGIALIIFAVILGLYIGPVPTMLVEYFPTGVRFTAMAISYNFCAALFGGTAPMVATFMIRETGNNIIVAWYMIICSIISLISLYFYRDQKNRYLKASHVNDLVDSDNTELIATPA